MQVHLISKVSFPVWTLGHFVGATDTNYSKLLQIIRIIELIEGGARDEQLSVATYSADLYMTDGKPPEHGDRLIVLAEKGVSADEFWNHFRSLRRPIVFSRPTPTLDWHAPDVRPLYSPTDPEGLKLLNATLETPIHISFEGVAKVIRQLFYGHSEERRVQEKHEAEMKIIAAKTAEQQIRTAKEAASLIEQVANSNISPAYKEKILEIAMGVSDRQGALNERLAASIGLGPEGEPPS